METTHQEGHSLNYFMWVYVVIFACIAAAVVVAEKTFIPN
jgi:hypothetical protein